MTQRYPIKDDFAEGTENPPFAPNLQGWIEFLPVTGTYGQAWLHDGYSGANAPAGRKSTNASADMQFGSRSDRVAWIRREEFQADQDVSAQFYIDRLPTSSKEVEIQSVDGFSVIGRAYGGSKAGSGRSFRYRTCDCYVFVIEGTSGNALDVSLERYNLGTLTTVATVQLDSTEAARYDFTKTFEMRLTLRDTSTGVDFECWLEEFVYDGARVRSRLMLDGEDELVRNLVGHSEDLTNTSWGGHGWRTTSGGTGTVTSVTKTSPKSGTTTFLLDDTDAGDTFTVDHTFTGLTDGADYVFSVPMQADTAAKMALAVQHQGGSKTVVSTYNDASKTVNVVNVASAQGTGGFVFAPESFVRIWVTATYDASHASDAGLTVSFAPSADGASATAQSWADMVQFEVGSETDGTSLPTAYQEVASDGLTDPLTNPGRAGFGMASDRQYVAGERDLVDHCNWWQVAKPSGAVMFREEWSRVDADVSHQLTDGLGQQGRILMSDYTYDIYSSQTGVLAPDGEGGIEWDPADTGIVNVPFLRLVPASSNVYQRRSITFEYRAGTTTDFFAGAILLRGSYPGVSGQPAASSTAIRYLPDFVGYAAWFFEDGTSTRYLQIYRYTGESSGLGQLVAAASGSSLFPLGDGNTFVATYDVRAVTGLAPFGVEETAYVEHRLYIDGTQVVLGTAGTDVTIDGNGTATEASALRVTGYGEGIAGCSDDSTRVLRFDTFARGTLGSTAPSIVVADEGEPSVLINDLIPPHFGTTEQRARPAQRVTSVGGHSMAWSEFSDGAGGVQGRRIWRFEAPVTTPDEHNALEALFDDLSGIEGAAYYRTPSGESVPVAFSSPTLDRGGIPVGAFAVGSFSLVELLNVVQELVLPKELWLITGRTTTLYLENLVRVSTSVSSDLGGLSVAFSVSGGTGTAYSNRWTFTAASAGTYTVTATLSRSGVVVDTQTLTVNVFDLPVGLINRGVLTIGDSLTIGVGASQTGEWLQEVSDLSDADSNSFTFCGKETSGSVDHEAHSGKTFIYFNGSGGPFWYSGAISVSSYVAEINAAPYSQPTPLFTIIFLGHNESYAVDPDNVESEITSILATADTLLTNLKASLSTDKYLVCSPAGCNSRQTAFAQNYGTDKTRDEYRAAQMRLAKRMEAHFRGRTSENIWFCPLWQCPNPVDGFNSNNALHPNASGYDEIAEVVYSALTYIRSL